MTKVSKGYILNSRLYKEADGMMSIYLEDNSYRQFIYRSLYKPGAKRLGSSQPFVLYEFTYRDKEGLITPREITQIKSYTSIQGDVKKTVLGQSINSLFLNFYAHLNFKLYDWAIQTMDQSDNVELVFILVLVKSLNQMGLQPYVDGDVLTGDSKVNHFDISKGGFVYRNLENMYTLSQLQMIRKLFKAKPQNYSIIKDDSIEDKVISTIVDYFEYHTSFKLKGYQLFKSIQ